TMLNALGEAVTPDEAARRAYGRRLDQLEDGWRTSLGLRPFDRGVASDVAAAPTVEPLTLPTASRASGSSPDWGVWLGAGMATLTLAAFAGGVVVIARKGRRAG